MNNRLILAAIVLLMGTVCSVKAEAPFDPSYQNNQGPNGNNNSSVYVPGISWGGIPLDDGSLYDIKPEKCKGSTTAEIIGEYNLIDKLFLLKTENGYVVAALDQTLKEIETGVRRKRLCSASKGMKIQGDIDCKGVRVVKQEPYDGCAFEAKVWGHSMTEQQAFNLLFERVKAQFMEYKKQCVVPAKRSIQDSFIKF
jgi:hypothetical protein